jgi:RNA polymerase sigma factor (sigma-70 family)
VYMCHTYMGPSSAVSSEEVSDSILVAQTMAGDQCAFEMLVSRYAASLFAFVGRYIDDYDQAGDILQHVFLQLYLSTPTLRVGKSVKPWLFRVARNGCLDELRRKRPLLFSELKAPGHGDEDEPSPVEMLPDTSPLPQDVVEQHDTQQALRRAIQTLSPKMRQVVLLRYEGQLSFAEIGQTLTIPEATAKSYFLRSKHLLRATLAAQRQVASG